MNKFYITTPIYYVNSDLHLGHLSTDLKVDAIARYNRLLGKEVYFLTGADEHGAKVARSAEKFGIPIEKFVDQNVAKFQELLKVFNISNDDFIRTSDQVRHWPGAQKLWSELVKNGDIYKKNYKGLYCVGHEAFVTEKDLVDGKCAEHDQEPEVIEEENYFFKLSRYTKEIETKIKKDELRIIPESRKNEILALLEQGLEDVSFSRPSRDISWGIPVPNDPNHTMYVWCDALANYISAPGYGGKDDKLFKKFWPADLHVIGKDILRFHAAIWPGMLLSAGIPLPKNILIHGFILSDGKKMSKTIGNVANPLELAEKYGTEVLRYYLLREISPYEDGDFTEESLKETYNANLANGLGNYVSRATKMIEKYFDGIIEKPNDIILSFVPFKRNLGFNLDIINKNDKTEYFGVNYLIEKFTDPEYQKAMEALNLQKAMDIIWELIGDLDKYIADYKPFKLIEEDRGKAQAVIWNLAYGLFFISIMLSPFMPETSSRIFDILGVSSDADIKKLKEFKIREHKGLFPRLD